MRTAVRGIMVVTLAFIGGCAAGGPVIHASLEIRQGQPGAAVLDQLGSPDQAWEERFPRCGMEEPPHVAAGQLWVWTRREPNLAIWLNADRRVERILERANLERLGPNLVLQKTFVRVPGAGPQGK